MTRTSSTQPVAAQDTDRKKKKRAAFVKFGFAGVALLGIGAAATSAAWTDDAWFSATATTPTIELQGSNLVAPVVWDNADTSAGAVVIPATAFANLEPGVAKSYTVSLKNISTVPLTVAAPTVTATGDIFAAPTPAVVTTTGAPGSLAALTGTATVTVTVTPPATWNSSATYQGKTGVITLQFQGATS